MKCSRCKAENPEDQEFCGDCGTKLEGAGIDPTASFDSVVLGPGSMVGQFRIERELGRGAVGVVYLAHDTKLDRAVAIKSLPEEVGGNPLVRSRFQREARLLAGLNHPNIATIHDEIKEVEGRSFLVLEYIAGDTLAERIEKGPLSIDEALSISQEIAEGVAAAHEQGVIHRDLKPGNIKITPEGKVKVLDFGLAKAVSGEAADQETTITVPGRVIGTPAYMSPEQARGNPVDHRSDIWSFGCVLFEMLTGKIPFRGETVSDTLANIINQEPDWKALPARIEPELRKLIRQCLVKEPSGRYQSFAEICHDLRTYKAALTATAIDLKILLRSIRKPKAAIPSVLIILVLCFVSIWFFSHRAKRMENIRWVKEEAIPEIKRFIAADNYFEAYTIANQAKQFIPNDTELNELWTQSTRNVVINTEPKDADIYFGRYESNNDKLEYLGKSSITPSLPSGYLRLKIIKEGYRSRESVVLVTSSKAENPPPLNVKITLDKEEDIPDNMVRVPAKNLGISFAGFRTAERIPSASYFIDSCEVTNREYKGFVDNGGYQNSDFWKEEFIEAGREIPRQEAMQRFRDSTGRPGPSTWAGGTYPAGQGEFPVSGISWYEAAAYAEYAGKELPTVFHWLGAAITGRSSVIVANSNFDGTGPVPVKSYPSGPYGVYDMAGNVREWCRNKYGEGRFVPGGAWNDPTYMYFSVAAMSPFDRSSYNGFRGVKYTDSDEESLAQAKRPVELQRIDWSKEKPVSDDIFDAYKSQYSYDPLDMADKVVSTEKSNQHWIKQEITINAAYGKEQLPLYIFTPKDVPAPFQTVIYFPGSGAILGGTSKNLPHIRAFDILIMSGRAVIFPVYKGTYERNDGQRNDSYPKETQDYTNWVIQLVNDVRRTIDYVETREDLDNEKIAYYGYSWGGRLGSIILALEDRFKTALLVVGGLPPTRAYPAATEINYLPRVTLPVLMINGTYDIIFPYETNVKPMFDTLGTLQEDKKLILYDAGHDIFCTHRNAYMRDLIDWLDQDKCLGPVNLNIERDK